MVRGVQLVVQLVLLTSGCSLTSYWGKGLDAANKERIEVEAPIARHAIWMLSEQTSPTVKPSFYLCSPDRAGEAAETPFVWPTEAAERAIEILERAQDPALARVQEIQPTTDLPTREVWTDTVGLTAERGLLVFAAGAAAHSFKSDDIQNVVDWALEDTGLIGPDAPEGSVLFLYMHRSARDASFGWKWNQSVQAVLIRDGVSIVSARTTPWWIYQGAPSSPPADMVHDSVIRGPDAASKPRWLSLYYDTALLVRSAGYELADAVRARASSEKSAEAL